MMKDTRSSEGAVAAERQLVQQACQGDGAAFTALYDKYLKPVYRYVAYRVGSTADVEDITQDVFLRAWRGIGKYRPTETPFVAWLYSIAHNLVIDWYRKKGRDQPVSLDESPAVAASVSTDAGNDPVLDRDVVQRLLVKLPPDQQQVLMLRFVEGLDYPEVAATLGKNQGAVRVLQFRALQRLRQLLGEGQ